MNIYQNKYKHLVLPQLATTATGAVDSTKRKYWFLASLGMGMNGLQAYYGEWEAPNMKPTSSNMENPHTDVFSYGVRAGYGFTFVSGRGIIGSFPTSS
jgi:hypothetical protein